MSANITIERGTTDDAQELAEMVGELLAEIMSVIGTQTFHFDRDETIGRLKDCLVLEKYFVFIARNNGENGIGFFALHESDALYAEGSFGTIPELYVRPEYRSKNIGHSLVAQAKSLGTSRGWKRLEVTTPPLPQFDKTLMFYEREGFSVTGGRKLKMPL